MVFGKKKEEEKEDLSNPKHIQVDMTEGGNEFVCTHKSHEGGRHVIVGNHDLYLEHLKSHGKRYVKLGAEPCMRCGKPADMHARPTPIGTKPMCQECEDYMVDLWKKEGRIQG